MSRRTCQRTTFTRWASLARLERSDLVRPVALVVRHGSTVDPDSTATTARRTYLRAVGTKGRYGDAGSRQKDNARTEANALQPSSLPVDLVTAAGGPITQAEHPTPVTAYVEVGVTLIRITGHATAWNSRCVHVRWTGTNPEASEAWGWASAVSRIPEN